jgi:hypothetical protein
MHGGKVVAASEGLGKGSQFTVRLPALESAFVKSAPARALPRVARQGSHVMVVDDNTDTADGLEKLLKRLGHDVRVAHDGPSAIELARAQRPEIILSVRIRSGEHASFNRSRLPSCSRPGDRLIREPRFAETLAD